MQASTFLNWRSKSDPRQEFVWSPRTENFFERHQVGQVLGGLVMSSLLWGLLAVGVYAVYSLVLGTI
ncbi:MAG: hypothetical protein PW789_05520 [Edaphobacter sp.]|uniref:hypothetical protein n=1 Tax=Edaphobacter sp. TaxID=1934404 RepID=UPI002398EDBE|nr:hypothetical protein [Edaphobacter sp.]MDE1176049.1 hypothetical protein [Edaphobacter sp.]